MIATYKKVRISDAEACKLMINGEELYSSQGIVKFYWDERNLKFMQTTDGVTQKPIEFAEVIIYHRKIMLDKQEVFAGMVEEASYIDSSDYIHELMHDADYKKELDELIEICIKLKEEFKDGDA
ncbi:hypothetical protein [Vibrio phage VCPH]|nr:hypothetical protein [Vibrio phage VCPH]